MSVTEYGSFLERKRLRAPAVGFDVTPDDLNPLLFEWQRRAVAWALKRGRAALFEDCGLGKTCQQLEWAQSVARETAGDVLIFAPLAVAQQTKREGQKFGIHVHHCRDQEDVGYGVNITNYEMMDRFDPSTFRGIVLDESSILKGDGPLRKGIAEFAAPIPYRLACTATPAPNDTEELINHAEFLGIRKGSEILAEFFTQDGNTTHKWKLKGHATKAFYQWLASWALALRKPSDIGGDDTGFDLPPLQYFGYTVDAPIPTDALIQAEARGIQEQRRVRKESLAERVSVAARLANGNDEPWLIWCDLNAESAALTKAIEGAVEVTGSMTAEQKTEGLLGFVDGKYRVLISKPSVAGFGMNFQHCRNAAFVGLGNSYEQYYQAIRRNWRFGQKEQVRIHVITSEADGPVIRNIARKEEQAAKMMDQLVKETRELTGIEGAAREDMVYEERKKSGEGWTLHLGDCVEGVAKLAENSIGLSVFSPPFPSMYAYTNSPRDIGNCADISEMLAHYEHLIPELLRITMPGRCCAVHLCQAVAFKGVDGHCGLKDFRGEVIRLHEKHGWIYYGECVIAKDPQVKAIRTKDRGLLFKTLANDSSHMHMALNDYILQFRKPGDNPAPIHAGISEKYGNPNGWITQEEWIEWACGVWTDIPETKVLQGWRDGKEHEDEKHICPLQLEVIERCIKLWSNPGETILTPFAGIGSEIDQAIRWKRRAVGYELKKSYWDVACRNAARAEMDGMQKTLFDDVVGVE